MQNDGMFTPAERRCAKLIPALAAWTVEHAWVHRIDGVFDSPVFPTWCLVDPQSLTLEDPCNLRVAAAWVWTVVKARDMMHFERVLELLEVFHTLLPQLVTPIKHMKIIMWMFRENQSVFRTILKIVRFFPDRFPQYHRCSRNMETLMRKTHHDFKALAQVLATKREMREAYLKEHVEEQYGERYAQKLEERLFHYLQELEARLPPTTNIERVLQRECPLVEGEELLRNVLSCSSALVPVLKRLQLCAISISSGTSETSQQCSMPRMYTGMDQSPNPPARSVEQSLPDMLSTSQETSNGTGFRMTHGGHHPAPPPPFPLLEQYSQLEQRMSHFVVAAWEERPLQLCSKHCRWVRSILQECSDEGRSHGEGIMEESSEEGRSHGEGIMEESSEEGRSHGEGIMENSEEGRSHGGGFVEESSEEGRSHGEGIMEENSEEGRSHGEGIMENSEEGRSHGGGFVEESRNHGGGFVEESSEEGWSHGGGFVEESSEEGRSHGGGFVEESMNHSEGIVKECLEESGSLAGGIMVESLRKCSRCSDFLTLPTIQPHPGGLSERIRLSVDSQLILIQSRLLQPLVRLRRLTAQECTMTTDQNLSKEALLLSCENSPFCRKHSFFTGSSSSDCEGDSDPDYIL